MFLWLSPLMLCLLLVVPALAVLQDNEKLDDSSSYFEQDDKQMDELKKIIEDLRRLDHSLMYNGVIDPSELEIINLDNSESDDVFNISDAEERYRHPKPRDNDEIVVNLSDLFNFDPDKYSVNVETSLRRNSNKTPKPTPKPKNPRTYNFVKRNKRPMPKYNTTDVLPPRNMVFSPNMMLLRALYGAAPAVVDLIAPRQKQDFVDQDLLEISQFSVTVYPGGLHMLWVVLSGPLAFVTLFLAIAVLMIIVARIGYGHHERPRRGRRPFERLCDPHLKRCLMALILILLSLYLLSAFCAYKSEQLMETAVDDLGQMGSNITRTISKGLQKSTQMIWQRWDPHTGNPPTFSINETDSFNRIWNFYFEKRFGKQTYGRRFASHLSRLGRLAAQVEVVQRDLADVRRHGSEIWFLAEQLNAGLRDVRTQLSQTLASCNLQACTDLQKDHVAETLNIDVPRTYTPGMSRRLEPASELVAGDLAKDLVQLRMNVTDMITKHAKFKNKFIDLLADSVRHALEMQGWLGYEFHHRLWFWAPYLYDTLEYSEIYRIIYEKDYAPYIKWVAFFMVVILPVPLILLLGWPWGLAGERAAQDGSVNVHSRSYGAWLTYCVMMVVVAMLALYCLCAVVAFTVALFIQRAICDPFHDPLGSPTFRILDDYFDIEEMVFKEKANKKQGFNITSVFIDMYHYRAFQHATKAKTRGRRMYQTFHIMRMMDLERYRFHVKLDAEQWPLAKRRVLAPRPPPPPAPLLSKRTARRLRMLPRLAALDLDLDIQRFPDTLQRDMKEYLATSDKLEQLAGRVERAAEAVEAAGERSVVAGEHYELAGEHSPAPGELRAAAALLRDLRRRTLPTMLQHAQHLNASASRLAGSRRLGGGVGEGGGAGGGGGAGRARGEAVKKDVDDLLDQIDDAETFLRQRGKPEKLRQIYNGYGVMTYFIYTVFRQYVPLALPDDDFLMIPIGNFYLTVCHHLLLPLHGMWICLALCVLLLLPLLLLSRNLARMFKRPQPYPGPAVVRAYDIVKAYAREKRRLRRRGETGDICTGACYDVNLPPPPRGARYFCCDKC